MALRKTVPDSPDALGEWLQDNKNLDVFKTPETTAEFMETYRSNANAADPDIQRELSEQEKQVLLSFLEDNGYAEDRSGKRLPLGDDAAGISSSRSMYKDLGISRVDQLKIAATGRGPAMTAGEGFEDIGDWLLAMSKAVAVEPSLRTDDERLVHFHEKALSEGVPGDGGVLVPEEFRAELMMLALEAAVVRSRARVIPMGSTSLRFPAIRDASHASSVFGGVVGTWVPEGGSVASNTNQPNFTGVRLVANKLTGYTRASNEILSDSAVALEALILSLFPQAINYFEDDAFINGTGAGQPLGTLNADAMVTVAKETGQSATTIVKENIDKMYSRMLPSSLGSAVWVAHNDTIPQLLALSQAVGTGGNAVMVMNINPTPVWTIYGRPVIFTEKAQTLGTAGDIMFVDYSHYLIGDRQALTMARSEHVLFTTDELVWRFIQRVDGRPWIQSALTPRNGSNTVSPFVTVATRA